MRHPRDGCGVTLTHTCQCYLGMDNHPKITVVIIHVILSGVLIGRETITSLQITAYE